MTFFKVKIRQKWVIIPFCRCSKTLGEAGKQEILQQMLRKFQISNRLPNRYFPENFRWVPLMYGGNPGEIDFGSKLARGSSYRESTVDDIQGIENFICWAD